MDIDGAVAKEASQTGLGRDIKIGVSKGKVRQCGDGRCNALSAGLTEPRMGLW